MANFNMIQPTLSETEMLYNNNSVVNFRSNISQQACPAELGINEMPPMKQACLQVKAAQA